MRIIDADNLKKELRQCHECQKCPYNGQRLCRDSCYINEVADLIDKQQTVEVLIPRGKWIFEKAGNDHIDGYICSICGRDYHTKVPYFSEYNYCPNCGAQMSEEVQE